MNFPRAAAQSVSSKASRTAMNELACRLGRLASQRLPLGARRCSGCTRGSPPRRFRSADRKLGPPALRGGGPGSALEGVLSEADSRRWPWAACFLCYSWQGGRLGGPSGARQKRPLAARRATTRGAVSSPAGHQMALRARAANWQHVPASVAACRECCSWAFGRVSSELADFFLETWLGASEWKLASEFGKPASWRVPFAASGESTTFGLEGGLCVSGRLGELQSSSASQTKDAFSTPIRSDSIRSDRIQSTRSELASRQSLMDSRGLSLLAAGPLFSPANFWPPIGFHSFCHFVSFFRLLLLLESAFRRSLASRASENKAQLVERGNMLDLRAYFERLCLGAPFGQSSARLGRFDAVGRPCSSATLGQLERGRKSCPDELVSIAFRSAAANGVHFCLLY